MSRFRCTSAAVAVAGALLAGATLAAAPADAAVSQYARLAITASVEHPGYYNVYIYGQSAKLNAGWGYRMYGDDEWFDDWITGGGGYLRTGLDGYFSTQLLLPGSMLDEDWGRDEVFVRVDVSGGSTLTTNNVNGYF